MPDPTFVTTVLALFTSAEKASEIHGDLLEERSRHGVIWYCLQVPMTCVQLALEAVRRQPVLLLLAYALYELALKLSWWVLRPLRHAIEGNESLSEWQQTLLNELLKISIAFLYAAGITQLARGSAGVLLLSATGMFLARTSLLYGSNEALELIALVVPMVFAAMLLVRWLQLRTAVSKGSIRPPLQGS
jgi:hypothetical protein